MSIGAYMLSCDARRAVRERTLDSLRAAGWMDQVWVEIDRSPSSRPQERQSVTSRLLLCHALEDGADVILFLEDDLEFNRHFTHNLAGWAPLRAVPPGGHFFASLYNPGVAESERRASDGCFLARSNTVYGSQAFLLSAATARFVVDQWERVPGMQDIKMSRLAAELTPVYYHVPSLVQHVGVSTWGGSTHVARDYDAWWRATADEPATAASRGSV